MIKEEKDKEDKDLMKFELDMIDELAEKINSIDFDEDDICNNCKEEREKGR